MSRLPPWIRIRLTTPEGRFATVSHALQDGALNTVCEHAHCPNRQECYTQGTATVMILGSICTRACRFCAVEHGVPPSPDPDEPKRVAELAKRLKLRHVVVTSVTRDDLPDGGSALFAETIRELRTLGEISIEVLTPDFQGNQKAVTTVLDARPDVFNHNIETVERLQPQVRPQADYRRSLDVLRVAAARAPQLRVKSGIMVGLGEDDQEIEQTLRDLRTAGCMDLTIGQYLAPSRTHLTVARFVHPDIFETYRQNALALGFSGVASGPLVRSSYRAEQLYQSRGGAA